jgi:Bcr/CflA subfamily drug resistance transporter
MQNKNISTVAFLLAPFVFSFAFGMDIFIPVVPEMQAVFHTSQFLIQLSLSLFLLTIGVSELFMGPLADQFGRYKMVIISIIIFMLGSLGCALANTIEFLIAARVVCAMGACGMLVVAFAIVRDLYDDQRSGKLYSWLNAAIGVSPTFAPVIGSYLGHFFGWRSVFWFLFALGGVVLLITIFFIRETLPHTKRKKIDRYIVKRYWTILTTARFIKYTLFTSLGVTVCFSFFSVSPFIIIKLLHVSQEYFGYCFAAFGLVLIIGGMIAAKLIEHRGIDVTLSVGIVLVFVGGISMLLINLFFGLHLASFLVTMVIACSGAVFFMGAGAGGALATFGDIAGTAAATLQSCQFLIAAIIGSIFMHFPVTSSISFAVLVILVALASSATKFIPSKR